MGTGLQRQTSWKSWAAGPCPNSRREWRSRGRIRPTRRRGVPLLRERVTNAPRLGLLRRLRLPLSVLQPPPDRRSWRQSSRPRPEVAPRARSMPSTRDLPPISAARGRLGDASPPTSPKAGRERDRSAEFEDGFADVKHVVNAMLEADGFDPACRTRRRERSADVPSRSGYRRPQPADDARTHSLLASTGRDNQGGDSHGPRQSGGYDWTDRCGHGFTEHHSSAACDRGVCREESGPMRDGRARSRFVAGKGSRAGRHLWSSPVGRAASKSGGGSPQAQA